MSCTLVINPIESKAETIRRWSEINSAITNGLGRAKELRSLKPTNFSKRFELKKEIKNQKVSPREVVSHAKKELYSDTDKFLASLVNEFEISFETYQMLEFCFRATLQSLKHFDYGSHSYIQYFKNQNAQQTLVALKKQIKIESKKHFFGLEDIRPTKMDYVQTVNEELQQHFKKVSELESLIAANKDFSVIAAKLLQELRATTENLKKWASDRVLGDVQNRGFMKFQGSEIVLNHKNFLYFKYYILALMGTYGRYFEIADRTRIKRIAKLAAMKLNQESKKHFDFKITSTFLYMKEESAELHRHIEELPTQLGIVSDDFLRLLVEENERAMDADLPFYLVGEGSKITA